MRSHFDTREINTMPLQIFTLDQLRKELERTPVKPLMRRSGVNRHTIMNIRDGVNRNPGYRVLESLVVAMAEMEKENNPE